MFARFKDRSYSKKTLKQARKKAWLTDRQDLLADKIVSTNGNKKLTSTQAPLRIITNYGAQWKQVTGILQKH